MTAKCRDKKKEGGNGRKEGEERQTCRWREREQKMWKQELQTVVCLFIDEPVKLAIEDKKTVFAAAWVVVALMQNFLAKKSKKWSRHSDKRKTTPALQLSTIPWNKRRSLSCYPPGLCQMLPHVLFSSRRRKYIYSGSENRHKSAELHETFNYGRSHECCNQLGNKRRTESFGV